MPKTHEEHVRRVREKHQGEIEVVGTFTHSLTRIEYRCRHGIFVALPHNVENGNRCRQCGRDATRITQEEHVESVKLVHGDKFSVAGKFIDSHTKINYLCPLHGIFSAKPANVVHRKSGCSKCWNENRPSKSHETYQKEVESLGFEVLEKYVSAITPILHRCPKDHIILVSPNQLLSKYGCALCDKSQYRRRPVIVGDRKVMVQGAEGAAVEILLAEGFLPDDLAFSKNEGRPTLNYTFNGTNHRYVPDFYIFSLDQIVEVKGSITMGIYSEEIFLRVREKARAAIEAKHSFRIMIIHRKRNISLSADWYTKGWQQVVEEFKTNARAQDLRYRRKHDTKP